MISIKDSLTLARTKLKYKRVRLIVTVVVSGLMFGLVLAATMIIDGIVASIDDYSKQSLDGKYIVQSMPYVASMENFDPSNSEVIKRVKELHIEYVAERKAVAKRLGVNYDEKTETQPTIASPFANQSIPEKDRMIANEASVAFTRYVRERAVIGIKRLPTLEDLKAVAGKYDAKRYFSTSTIAYNKNLAYMKDGKEDLTNKSKSQAMQNVTAENYFMQNISTSNYKTVDSSVLKTFMLQPNARRAANKNAVPVMLSVGEAVSMFGKQNGIPEKPIAPTERIEWIKQLRDKMNGYTYSVCYRNATSQSQVTAAIEQLNEISQNKNNKDYVQPPVTYKLPAADECGPVQIIDKRSAVEQKAERDQQLFEAEFDNYEVPTQKKITFVIVGILPDSTNTTMMASGLEGFMSALLGTSYPVAAIVPLDEYKALPVSDQHAEILIGKPRNSQDDFFERISRVDLVEFDSIANAKRFTKEQGCSPYTGTCEPGRKFVLAPFGTNYSLIDDMNASVGPVLQVVLTIVAVVATIIILAMMGRVMADSRRETAVFRAIGARRSDISKVYIIYSMGVALRILAFAILLGLVAAGLIELAFARDATAYAEVAYGVFNGKASFHFMGMQSGAVFWLASIILLSSLVAVSFALLRNVRRNPISDMRDE